MKKEEQKLCFLVIINYTINESNGVIWKLSIPLTVSDNKKAGLSRARIFWENIHLKVSNQFYDVPLSLKWKDIRKALNEEFSAIGGNIPENNFNSLFNILLNIEATPIRNKFGPEAPDADITFKCFAKDEFIVAYKMFRRTSISFFNWFYSALELIRDDEVLLGLWKENLITGFVGRDEASRMLIGTLPGTFVVRFSETKIGKIC